MSDATDGRTQGRRIMPIRTLAEAISHHGREANMSLFWPPTEAGGYALIVNGTPRPIRMRPHVDGPVVDM